MVAGGTFQGVKSSSWGTQYLMPLRLVTLPDNLLDFVNKNKPFPPVQRKQQQKYTENKGKGLQWNDFFGLEEVPHCQKTDQLVFRLCYCFCY